MQPPKMGLHCIFGLMFREILNLLIHYTGEFWDAVNQSFSQESVSSRPVTNMGPKGLCFARGVLDMSLGKIRAF